MATRIILADDHAILRDGLRLLLEGAGIQVIGEAQNGLEAVNLARSLRPRVVVIDLSMPVMNGIEAAAEIRRELGIPSVLLTIQTEELYVVRAFEAGLAGYVIKSRAYTCLVEAIREVASGNTYLCPGLSTGVIREMLHQNGTQRDPLTLRERQVLQMIAEGFTTKEIADFMGIGVRTGECHRSNIMEKLGIHHIAGLVRYAIRQGLTQL